jgi:hypothetical protein
VKNSFFHIVFVAAFIPSVSMAGNPAHCYSIKDQDQKGLCYSILNSDMKNSCLAQVGGDRSRCYSINDRDQKERCLAEH